MIKRQNAKKDSGFRMLELKEITCRRCGDKQECQKNSNCHTSKLCLMCANQAIKQQYKDSGEHEHMKINERDE